ncbi:MAG: EamA family transporter [Acidobacteriota bacterium]|nr:EamA family transporter [Acidobacteriota bacterium]
MAATRRREAPVASPSRPPLREAGLLERLPPASFFLTSAVFHYLGPSLAVLLFAHVAPLGVMWLRIVAAAAVFALWRRPWRMIRRLDRRQRLVLIALAAVLAGMNSLFYLAADRLPLATVGAIEFLGTVMLATLGVRSRRNLAALGATVAGVALLTALKLGSDPLGYLFAFGNCVGFVVYVVLGHQIANVQTRSPADRSTAGIDQLGASMGLAALVAAPVGIPFAMPAVTHPLWLLWGAGVGVCSSVIPYVTDQFAMARLPRATFALMLALLPACATVIGIVVLGQIPTVAELVGIGLVVAGLVVHQSERAAPG